MSEQTEKHSLNIYQRINAVIKEGIYIKRGSAGQGTGVLYDEVISVIRPHLTKHGIIIIPEKSGESRSRANQKDNYVYESDFDIHYVNMDDPSDRFTSKVEAHAMDSGDKAPGKAITYAAKISMVKVFQIETGINDESRLGSFKPVTKAQADQLEKALDNDSDRIERFCSHYSIESVGEVPQREFKAAMAAIRKSNEAQQA